MVKPLQLVNPICPPLSETHVLADLNVHCKQWNSQLDLGFTADDDSSSDWEESDSNGTENVLMSSLKEIRNNLIKLLELIKVSLCRYIIQDRLNFSYVLNASLVGRCYLLLQKCVRQIAHAFSIACSTDEFIVGGIDNPPQLGACIGIYHYKGSVLIFTGPDCWLQKALMPLKALNPSSSPSHNLADINGQFDRYRRFQISDQETAIQY